MTATIQNTELQTLAADNLDFLQDTPYPGRGIIIGFDEWKRNLVQVYWVMGRSVESRNRVLVHADQGRVVTAPFDSTHIGNSQHIFYNAMFQYGKRFVVGNGNQTDTAIARFVGSDRAQTLEDALAGMEYESDAPHYTPRITGLCDFTSGLKWKTVLSIQRKSSFSDACDNAFWTYGNIPPGFGYCITTYAIHATANNPLPSFQGEPFLLPLAGGSAADILHTYRKILNPENFVGIAVKLINCDRGTSLVSVQNKPH